MRRTAATLPEVYAGLLLGFLLLFSASAGARPAADSDANCLACHGNKDFKSDSGRGLYVEPAKHQASVHAVLNCTECHADIKEFPHPQKVAKVECATCHADQASAVSKSVHIQSGSSSCTSCHGAAHYIQAAANVMPRQCASCHTDEVKNLLFSAHRAGIAAAGTGKSSCQACHGPVHNILSAADPLSPVAKLNLPGTCASCHSNPEFLAKYKIPFAHPVEAFRLSVHGRALASGNVMRHRALIVIPAMAFFPGEMHAPKQITGIFRLPAGRATRTSRKSMTKACMEERWRRALPTRRCVRTATANTQFLLPTIPNRQLVPRESPS